MAGQPNASGILLPQGAVPPDRAMAAQMQGLRITIAVGIMTRLAVEEEHKDPGAFADRAVECADALLRRLSAGPFALPIKWEESGQEVER